MKLKKVPSRALRFSAGLEITQPTALAAGESGDMAGGLPAAPVKLVALSGEIVNHWWFGPVIHDLAGMTPAAAKLPLDYCHFCDEVIGFSDQQDVTSGQLVMSGQLVPFTAEDRASEVIFKGKSGVPYQASIYFDPGAMVIEEVPAGMSTQVNGKELPGPLTVFRQWQLRGAAVCPYGMDSHTETQFSVNDQKEVEIQCKGEQAAEVPETPAEVAPVPAEVKPEETPVTELAAEEVKPEATPEVTPEVEVTPAEVPPTTELTAEKPILPPASSGKQFLEAFGDKGGVWFAEGKTFDEARTLFTKSLQDQIGELTGQVSALKKTNAEQAALLTANRGETSPMTFSSAEETTAPKASAPISTLPEGSAKFAANIKMPRS